MSTLSTNSHKYPKYIHSVQYKCLRNFKNRNKSTIHNNKWRDSQSLLHSNIHNYVLQREYKVINSNNKSLFCKYVNSRCSSHNGISPLIKDDNSYASIDKAVLLNDQFTSVFTNDNGIIPDHTLTTENTINDIIFTREMDRICLCKLIHVQFRQMKYHLIFYKNFHMTYHYYYLSYLTNQLNLVHVP